MESTLRKVISDDHDKARAAQPLAPVCELREADRSRLLAHFMALGSEDRLLRFGHLISDGILEHYVAGLDFTADSVFGVFNDTLELVGVGHLGYLKPDGAERTAELGVSVLGSARGQGIGTRLFERAAMRCRNSGVTTLYMHCLSRNATMMHIAKKAGMRINFSYGEADAYLTLAPADQESRLREARQQRAAAFDYAQKHRARSALQLSA